MQWRSSPGSTGGSPDRLSEREIQRYLVQLNQERGLSHSTGNQVAVALRFFYRVTLRRPATSFVIPAARTGSAPGPAPFAGSESCGVGSTPRAGRAGPPVSTDIALWPPPPGQARHHDLVHMRLEDLVEPSAVGPLLEHQVPAAGNRANHLHQRLAVGLHREVAIEPCRARHEMRAASPLGRGRFFLLHVKEPRQIGGQTKAATHPLYIVTAFEK